MHERVHVHVGSGFGGGVHRQTRQQFRFCKSFAKPRSVDWNRISETLYFGWRCGDVRRVNLLFCKQFHIKSNACCVARYLFGDIPVGFNLDWLQATVQLSWQLDRRITYLDTDCRYCDEDCFELFVAGKLHYPDLALDG